MRADHRAALIDLGIPTLRALAESSEDELAGALSLSTRRRLHQQARLQLAERESGVAQFELLPPEPERGLQMLPEPDEGDVYLDFEGDPWAEGERGVSTSPASGRVRASSSSSGRTTSRRRGA